MPEMREQDIERIRRDHDHILELITRIKAECIQRDKVQNCNTCQPNFRMVCRGNIEQLIKSFVEVTLKHNLIESMYMEEGVPAAHRSAHNRAHMQIAEQLKAIRVVFTADGNGIQAIEGVEQALVTLTKHFKDFDEELEGYLLAPA
jgi:hemerythrin